MSIRYRTSNKIILEEIKLYFIALIKIFLLFIYYFLFGFIASSTVFLTISFVICVAISVAWLSNTPNEPSAASTTLPIALPTAF